LRIKIVVRLMFGVENKAEPRSGSVEQIFETTIRQMFAWD